MPKKTSKKKKVSKAKIKSRPSKKSKSRKKAITHLKKSNLKKSRISLAAQRIVQRVLDRTSKIEAEDKTLESKLQAVLANQKLLLKKDQLEIQNQKEMLKEEKKVLTDEDKDDKEIEDLEKKQMDELSKLESLEKEIEKHIEPHPLLKVGIRDVVRGSLGALAGVVIHYTFVYGIKVAEQLSTFRATILFIVCFLIGFVFLYVTGFRKIQDKKILLFMPIRLVILYLVSLAMSIIVLWFFFPDFGINFTESYAQVASVMLPALIGACTADLIGKE